MREHVDLAYATTTHRSQGRTVDTSHVLVNESTTRQALYVGISRGRTANNIYYATGEQTELHAETRDSQIGDAPQALQRVLANNDAQQSAHEVLNRAATDMRAQGPIPMAPHTLHDPRQITPRMAPPAINRADELQIR